MDDGRDAVADVGEGPLLVLEERVPLHRIRTVETQAGRPAIQTETIHDMVNLRLLYAQCKFQ